MVFSLVNISYDNFFPIDSPEGVKESVNEVDSQVSEVNTLLASAEPGTPVHNTLQEIHSLMTQLSAALSSYLALLQTGRNRFKRSTGKVVFWIKSYEV